MYYGTHCVNLSADLWIVTHGLGINDAVGVTFTSHDEANLVAIAMTRASQSAYKEGKEEVRQHITRVLFGEDE